MKDQDLEDLIRSLKPSPLPDDLKTRLAPEPIRPRQSRRWRTVAIAAAAVVAIGLFSTVVFLKPKQQAGAGVAVIEPEAPVSVLRKDSTLLNSRTLAIKEIEGQLWEISEEEWRDHTLALCSVGPTELNSTVIRREVVCSPVEFQ